MTPTHPSHQGQRPPSPTLSLSSNSSTQSARAPLSPALYSPSARSPHNFPYDGIAEHPGGTTLYDRPFASPQAPSHAAASKPIGERGVSMSEFSASGSHNSSDGSTTLTENATLPYAYDGRTPTAPAPAQSTDPLFDHLRAENASIHSRTPLHVREDDEHEKHVQFEAGASGGDGGGKGYKEYPDVEKQHQKARRKPSKDLFRGEWYNYNSADAKVDTLRFAEGDVPKSRFAKFYFYLLNMSIVTRWALYIIPLAAILWIPGLVELTAFPGTSVWSVRLRWWSVWLCVLWVGWWGAWAIAKMLPFVVRNTVGTVIRNVKHYVDYVQALEKYFAFVGWAFASWVVYNVVIAGKRNADTSSSSSSTITVIAQVLFGIVICAGILLGEKFIIQIIAYNFHQVSYADRIAEHKFALKSLATLYAHSRDLGRSDTLDGFGKQKKGLNPARLLKRAAKEAKEAAASATTALGNVASEIAGSSVLQPNSPQSMVVNALSSPNKTRQLARRLFYSHCPPHREVLILDDIAKFFPNLETAEQVFAQFDKDLNGDLSRDELELACMELRRDRLSLTASMRDLDSAVGNLDRIFMSVYLLIAALVIVAMLEVKLSTLITSAGTFIVGISWLIASTAQEILASIIFLFVKHPYDVSDRVSINEDEFVVKEIFLLSTVFRRMDGVIVQAPHAVLNTQYIRNIRRSGPISETFEFAVAYGTTFEQIEELRSRMLEFVQAEKRDFLPQMDISIMDMPEQSQMNLAAGIPYKSNWQNGALKEQRRVKWIAALKISLAECKIYGPSGDPDSSVPILYTKVPYNERDGRSSSEPTKHESALERNPSLLAVKA